MLKIFVLILILLLIAISISIASPNINIDDVINAKKSDKYSKVIDFKSKLSKIGSDSSLFYLKELSKNYPHTNSPEYVAILAEIASAYNQRVDSVNYNRYYNEAKHIANKGNFSFELAKLYINKADYFKYRNILDSTLYYCLLARDVVRDLKDKSLLVPINHLIGDVYHLLEFYDDALIYYLDVVKYGKDNSYWEYWRKIVIYTNIGNIYSFNKDYQNAYHHFKIAENAILKNAKKNNQQPNSTQIAHLYNRIAYMFYYSDRLDTALQYIEKAINYLETTPEQKPTYSYIYVTAGKIYSKLGEYQKAHNLINYAISIMNNKNSASLEYIYFALSENYARTDQFDSAYKYLELSTIEWENNRIFNQSAKILQTKMLNDYKEYQFQINKERFAKRVYLVISLLLFASVIIVFVYQRKLHRTYKVIVDKTLSYIYKKDYSISKVDDTFEIVENIDIPIQASEKDETQINLEISNEDNVDFDDDKEDETSAISYDFSSLAKAIEEKLEDNPIIFDNNFTINDLARLVNSNRDYVSKAINRKFNVPFQVYINDLRVISAIKLMKLHKNDNYKMEYFMEKVGFSNRVTFSNSFKRYTGMTPSAFYKTLTEK